MKTEPIMGLTLADHQAAMTEVAFLIDIFTSTIDNIMGGSIASVGRMAGRNTARKYPIHTTNPSLKEAVNIIGNQMKAGFGISLESGEGFPLLVMDRCILRDICNQRNIELGQAMCRLFHAYLDGIINELVNRPVKSEINQCGPTCQMKIMIQ